MSNKPMPIFENLSRFGVVPVIAIDDASAALGLADALAAGGLPVAEITFRTAAAAEVMKRIVAQRPDMIVGAGTVLTADNLKRAVDSGAKFAVAPGFNPTVVQAALDAGLPFAPGVMTPSDIEGAVELGCRVLKFFPAGAAGGVKMLSAISAPYKHLGVKFVPTGGIKPENMHEYLQLSEVAAVGGTWLATRESIAGGDWAGIAARCADAVKIVRAVRG